MRHLALVLILCFVFTTGAWSAEPPFALPEAHELGRIRSALIETDKGKIYCELYPDEAPWHVANFKYLADRGFYRNSQFHIVEPGYIAQGGGQPERPTAGPGYSLPPEFSYRRHEPGLLGMARAPDDINPERRSSGSQFHILMREARHMDGNFTVFGKVLRGLDVVQALEKGDRIKNVTVYVRGK